MKGPPSDITRILVITNILMTAAICVLVARELFDGPESAYASGGAAGGKYIAVPIQFQNNREALMVIDTSSDVMIAYNLDARGDKIHPTTGRTIDQDFKLVAKLKDNYFAGVGAADRQYYPRSIRDALKKGTD